MDLGTTSRYLILSALSQAKTFEIKFLVLILDLRNYNLSIVFLYRVYEKKIIMKLFIIALIKAL